ncbi:MAG: hypothetical protein ACP5PB_08390 [Acidimicrobiales bacterium]
MALSGCVVATSRATLPPRHDPRTVAALVRVARAFNRDYQENRDGLVYERWDRASRAIISRRAYVRRHRECPGAPGPAIVEGASPGAHGYWVVRYEIGGVALTDYWHYQDGRWVFNLARSNPSAVALYRLPFAAYARAVG